MTPRRTLPVMTAALLLLAGCATSRPRQDVQFDPEVLTGDPELANFNDEELFAKGSARYANGELTEAIRFFDRLSSQFPDSPHAPAARYKAGLAFLRQEKWEEAQERLSQVADPAAPPGDALEAAFRSAEALYHLNRFEEAGRLLHLLSARNDLPVGQQLEAQVQEGVCLVESGRREEAEALLRRAVERYEGLADKTGVNDYYPAQAQFFLGELYRLAYQEVVLQGAKGVDALAEDLEHKAQLLLSAQGHYLRAIRIGNGYWATAAGQRIGNLYEDLYEHILASSPPPELNPEEADLYREELRKKVRVLITKAITVYEQTLEAAERVGTSGPFIESTRQSLEKMKQRLVEDAEAAEPSALLRAGGSGLAG